MKTAAQIASHPKARLHRELVTRVRAFGSIEGANLAWQRFPLNRRLWKRIVTYGLSTTESRAKLNKIAFPETNFAEVDAALQAGNNLNRIYELARGRAWIKRDSVGHCQIGAKGLRIVEYPP